MIVVPHSSLTNGLIGFWPLDEASGSRRATYSAHTSALTLTDNNTVAQANGVASGTKAASFTRASNERLSITSNSTLQCGDIDFTASCWVYLTDNTSGYYPRFMSKGTTSALEWILEYDRDTSKFMMLVSSNGSSFSYTRTTNTVAQNTWHHIVGWHDATNNQIGITMNNATADTSSYASGCYSGTGGFAIGGSTDTSDALSYVQGRIQNAGFWKRVLTSAERATLYNGGSGLAYPFLK